MSRFTGPLKVSFFTEDEINIFGYKGQMAVLNEPLVWEIDFKGSGMIITIPKGFVTDGSTVPRLLWWLMPPWGDVGTRAAILHDYLREMIDERTPVDCAPNWSGADKQFHLALRALGVGKLRAFILWQGVKIYSFSLILGKK